MQLKSVTNFVERAKSESLTRYLCQDNTKDYFVSFLLWDEAGQVCFVCDPQNDLIYPINQLKEIMEIC
jgi:hypothetical protein